MPLFSLSTRHIALTAAAALTGGVLASSAASADVRFDPATNTGFVDAVDVQKAFGWTAETLTRNAFEVRFTHHVGEPPLSYLTHWRIELAARKLRDTTLPTATIARDVGYTSEYAFNRAFTRVRGCPPGRYRRTAHVGATAR